VLLTALVVFVFDTLTETNAAQGGEPRNIVNWDVAAERLRSTLGTIKEEVREDVHDATAD
jgi:hypothetical protein